jgi:putative endonuclease
MEKYYCYIIFSKDFNRFYHGSAADLKLRLKDHNAGKVRSTKAFCPWQMVYWEEFDTREQALEREKYFKTGGGRRFLKSIKEKVLKEMEGSPPA